MYSTEKEDLEVCVCLRIQQRITVPLQVKHFR